MGFWIYMLGTEILIPLIMIIFGYVFAHKAPEKINWLYGYRTRRSMMNMDTWSYAHRYIGKLWQVMGFVILLVTVIVMLLVMRKDKEMIGLAGGVLTALQLIPMIGSLFVTESELKKTFDESGNRR
ncbi:MAG: SdpI family protein [Solobacterium sp.]|nr:SdpI family protein [Solobacterium sp.]